MNHKVCPQCGSENMDFETGFITGKYRCGNCGYVGSIIFEFNDENYKKFLEQLAEENKEKSKS
ncbi:MAG: hypothetical protein M1515_03265 [Candidatus Thermoplasmatota archaeon]|nr:hypothetical protein [Candidatus Thermoplasmatota archaeon]